MNSPQSPNGLEVYEQANVLVTKIGGNNAGDIQENVDRISERQQAEKKQVLAISAIRSSSADYNDVRDEDIANQDTDSDGNVKDGFNTTSHLIGIADAIANREQKLAIQRLDKIRAFTKRVVANQIRQDAQIDDSAITEFDALIDSELQSIESVIQRASKENIKNIGSDHISVINDEFFSITGAGESLARTVYSRYLELRHVAHGVLTEEGIDTEVYGVSGAREFTKEEGESAIETIETTMRNRMQSILADSDIAVAGGYSPHIGGQRGYSDKMGALLARAAHQIEERVVYLIEKEYPIMSADPRKLPNAQTIKEMTYALAMEAFGNIRGADGGAIHPSALNMLATKCIDTLVLNPDRMSADEITYVHDFEPNPNGIELVASRQASKGVIIESTKMYDQPGFIKLTSSWLDNEGISIDQIATSERSTSFTFNRNGMSEGEFTKKVEAFMTFAREQINDPAMRCESVEDKTLIFCLGNNMKTNGQAMNAILGIYAANAGIHFVTQGFKENVMTFMVDPEHKDEVLRLIHRVSIELKNDEGLAQRIADLTDYIREPTS